MTEEIRKVDKDGPIVLAEVNTLIAQLSSAEIDLEHSYAKLGFLLTEVSEHRYWVDIGFESFGKYMNSLAETFNRGRTQLYQYHATAKELRPYVTEEQLNDMGIAKAMELKKATKRSGFPPSAELIERAVDPKVTVSDVRKLLFEAGNPDTNEKGIWLDREGFYVTPDEKLVITSAEEAALRTDPIVAKDVPAWVRRKEIALRLSMEYLAGHGDKAEKGEA